MKGIEQLKKSYKELDEEKKRLKDMNAQVKDECANSHQYGEIDEEMTTLRGEAKIIKEAVIDDLQLRDDILESKLEIASLKELIADVTINLMMEGNFNPLGELEIGDFTIMPRVSVSYKKQLSMNLSTTKQP